MNILEYCTPEEKDIIGQIVDGYLFSYENMKADINSIHNSPGLFFFSLFQNYNGHTLDYHINLCNDNGILIAQFFIKDSKDANSFFQTLYLKKAELMSRIVFIENLLKNNLIFFETDKTDKLPKYIKPDNNKLEKLEKENFKVYPEPINNQSFFDLIDKYYWSRVIPSSTLIEYRRNGYETTEQKRYNEQISKTVISLEIAQDSLKEAKKSNQIAKKSNWITLCVAGVTFVFSAAISWYCASYIPTNINESFSNQLNYNLERIITIDSVAKENLYNTHNRLDSIEMNMRQPQSQKINK